MMNEESGYTKKIIHINGDLLIEIHYNPTLSNRPYNLRVYTYNDYTEQRLNQQEMFDLAESIAEFALHNTKTESNYTGLAGLWYNRRNEALDEIEELNKKLDNYE